MRRRTSWAQNWRSCHQPPTVSDGHKTRLCDAQRASESSCLHAFPGTKKTAGSHNRPSNAGWDGLVPVPRLSPSNERGFQSSLTANCDGTLDTAGRKAFRVRTSMMSWGWPSGGDVSRCLYRFHWSPTFPKMALLGKLCRIQTGGANGSVRAMRQPEINKHGTL